ncbi:MAG TPA: DUF3465 domain-containing protein [Steroidobacteraceae bacterium]|nr:DUF3465 domain-containing protein [Steroidobacteraceae bacterium]
MKKLALVAIVLAAVYFGGVETGFIPGRHDTGTETSSADQLSAAFESHRSNVQVEGSGRVTRVLPDDNDGSRHQRFIVQLGTGQTVLVAHNIDLAARVASLKAGDRVEFNGEYEWNERGGVIHWTHRDPQRRHVDGWIKHDGRTYQ